MMIAPLLVVVVRKCTTPYTTKMILRMAVHSVLERARALTIMEHGCISHR